MTRDTSVAWALGLLANSGIKPGSERYEVCVSALRYLGFSYERNEELVQASSIDCSTLISQSFWEGALIGVPFTAEGQRVAASGVPVTTLEETLPGDVLVRYASLDDSPDRKWNHVGLYLGKDDSGCGWLIESVGGHGVRFAKVETFHPQGGIKNFVLREDPISSPSAIAALRLARFVPKFGRLGVRQYRRSNEARRVHRGLDIYVPMGTRVIATHTGKVTIFRDLVEHSDGVEIRSSDGRSARYLMLDRITVVDGSDVKVGTLLGFVNTPSETSEIVYSNAPNESAHLHLEYRSWGEAGSYVGNRVLELGWVYQNHLYLSKVGELPLPFDALDGH